MSFHISTSISLDFNRAMEAAEAALAKEGFGVNSRIDIQATLKDKIGVDRRPYTILGACNSKLAHEALQLEDKVGTMLPCDVIVQDLGSGEAETAAIDPIASTGGREWRVARGGGRSPNQAQSGDRQPRPVRIRARIQPLI